MSVDVLPHPSPNAVVAPSPHADAERVGQAQGQAQKQAQKQAQAQALSSSGNMSLLSKSKSGSKSGNGSGNGSGKSGDNNSSNDSGNGSSNGNSNNNSNSRGRPDIYLIAEHDVVYEQELIKNPYNLKAWLDYTNFKRTNGSLLEHAFVLERAVTVLPRSYKLWKMYLTLRTKHLAGRNSAKHANEFNKVNALFERALVLLNKMPRMWEMYLEFLLQQPLVTTTRRTFDRALRALPITQHPRIWTLYIPFAKLVGGATALKIWKRYMQLAPERVEEYITLLVDEQQYTDAVRQYIAILNNPRFVSRESKGPFQFWLEMLELLIDHARALDTTSSDTAIDVESIVRSGIARFPDQRGILWVSLARYYINLGHHEKARDIFEEGITTVMTVRDFTVVFDAYAETEEAIIGFKMDEAATRSDKGRINQDLDLDLDIRMLRFESLMDRRPFLINDVLLRQNPHNVAEWEKRVALWGDNAREIVQTYADAIAAVHPKKAVGQFHELWTNYAKFYEKGGDLNTARILMEKAVKVPYKSVAELAEMWCAWAELELRNENFERAVDIMAKATQAPKRSTVDYFDETLSPQQRIHKSWKLWSFYVDLVESVGTLDDTKKIYERIFELRIATPQTVVNYANLLEENGYHEDSFKIYERGLDLFSYPVAFELWNLYLQKAVDRRLGMERLRDLFEQAVEGCPPKFAKVLYLMYGALEEERGLARHAMRIYERATRAVADEDRADMFNYYITKSASNFGLTSTRPIYERAISSLPDNEAKDMCLKFAEMERRLGEVDRARAIYAHASQFADPRVNAVFWKRWEEFEVAVGNEDTYREMLRVKRSVVVLFNTDVNFIATQALAKSKEVAMNNGGAVQEGGDADAVNKTDAMAQLERQARAPTGFVPASSGPVGGNRPAPAVAAVVESMQTNDEEIDLGDEL